MHYLYDISLPGRKGLRVGSKVFLWGTKRIGKHGLFASGICEKSDDLSMKSDKEFDAFALIKHDRTVETPIPAEKLKRDYETLSSIVEKIESSTLLEFFRLDDAQARLLDQALSTWAGRN